MNREIEGVSKHLKLRENDIIDFSEFEEPKPPIFTLLGTHFYGLFVILPQQIKEAQIASANNVRLDQMMEKETNRRLNEIEGIWERKIPRDDATIRCLKVQFMEVVGKKTKEWNIWVRSSLTKK